MTLIKVTLVALCGFFAGQQTYGQSKTSDTNAVIAVQATNVEADPLITTHNLAISPEIRTEVLKAAADEIGHPGTNDLDDLLSWHSVLKQKVLAIQARHSQTTTNTPSAPASLPAAPSAAHPQVQAAVDLDRVIGQLSAIRDQLSQPEASNP